MSAGIAAKADYRGKRALDLAVLLVVAVPALVLGLAGALLVLVTDGRPVLYRQRRIGRAAVPFTLYKLRTMTPGADRGSRYPEPAMVTPVGRWLRRLSIDELPQLLNVLRGDMSLVGPRPTLGYQVPRYSVRQRGRLAVRPGLTGLAQLHGRNTTLWSQRIELDLHYVSRQSLRLDLALLGRTVAAVVTGGRSGVDGHPVDDPIATDDPAVAATHPFPRIQEASWPR